MTQPGFQTDPLPTSACCGRSQGIARPLAQLIILTGIMDEDHVRWTLDWSLD